MSCPLIFFEMGDLLLDLSGEGVLKRFDMARLPPVSPFKLLSVPVVFFEGGESDSWSRFRGEVRVGRSSRFITCKKTSVITRKFTAGSKSLATGPIFPVKNILCVITSYENRKVGVRQ